MSSRPVPGEDIPAPSILLIDDDPYLVHALRRQFERAGWRVCWAMSGEEGLRLQESAVPDVVLLDLHLPGMSGLHVLEALSAREATTILLTGQGDVPTAVEAMRLGAENFLTKPVQPGHLLAAAERAREKVELRRANRRLAGRLARTETSDGLVGVSPRMRELEAHIELLAASASATVLLLGESGTGKGWVARLLHERSPRARGPLVELNCAGLSATFLDSELFGHEKGAFTDAKGLKLGLFEVASGGTLFLDEIGDLAPELQPKLLKVLEQKTFRRLGGTREMRADVRLVAATNRDLQAEVRAGRFREDLYYRLHVLPLTLPPLRERGSDDVLALVYRLLAELRSAHPRAPVDLAPQSIELLLAHPWPGNVRELRNALERAQVLAAGAELILPVHLPPELHTSTRATRSRAPDARLPKLAEIERQHIEGALLLCEGNRSHTATALGISRATLHVKIKLYGLEAVGR